LRNAGQTPTSYAGIAPFVPGRVGMGLDSVAGARLAAMRQDAP
jgi:hypothetical protein